MISRIKDCVLVSLDIPESDDEEQSDDESLENVRVKDTLSTAIETIIANSNHEMIFDSSESKIYHAQFGKHTVGVRSHSLFSMLQPEAPFGFLVVFNIKDDPVRKNLMEVVKKWDPTQDPELYQQIINDNKRDSQNRLILQTPLTGTHSRTVDTGTPEHISLLELYRAFRAYERNRLKLPLSKNKGVACTHFVGYALKVAIIMRLFPDGLPSEIQSKIKEIENKKTPIQKKLSFVDPIDFVEFEKIVLKHVSQDFTFLQKELYQPVKRGDFCEYAFENDQLYDFGGYVFIKYKDQTPELFVMPHAVYLKFIEKYPNHTAAITQEELESLGIEIDLKNAQKTLHTLTSKSESKEEQAVFHMPPEIKTADSSQLEIVDNHCNKKIKEIQSISTWGKFFSTSTVKIIDYQSIQALSPESKIMIAAAMKKDENYLEKYHFMVKKAVEPTMHQLFQLKKNQILDFEYKSPEAQEIVARIKIEGNKFTDRGLAEIFIDENQTDHSVFNTQETASYAEHFKIDMKNNIDKLIRCYNTEVSQLPSNKPI